VSSWRGKKWGLSERVDKLGFNDIVGFTDNDTDVGITGNDEFNFFQGSEYPQKHYNNRD